MQETQETRLQSLGQEGLTTGGGNGNPLQYSCLENPMDRGAWWAIVHGVIKQKTNRKERKETEATQSRLTLCDPMDCSLQGSSIHGILQARILEWVAISFSRRSSWPRDWTRVFHIVGRCFTIWATKEVIIYLPICKFFGNFWNFRLGLSRLVIVSQPPNSLVCL